MQFHALFTRGIKEFDKLYKDDFSQPVNSAILENSNMEQRKPYLELRNLSSGKDLWCIVHSSTQRKTVFKGFVQRVIEGANLNTHYMVVDHCLEFPLRKV